MNDAVTRSQLYALVWESPMLKVAERLGVSSSYLARVCAALDVPRPARGYWAKLQFGQAPDRPLLPDVPGTQHVAWVRGEPLPTLRRMRPKPVHAGSSKRSKAAGRLLDEHPLLTSAKSLFETGGLSYDIGYLKPNKRLLVDLVASPTGLGSALDLASRLFLALEAKAHSVVIASRDEQFHRAAVDEREKPDRPQTYSNLWQPARPTIVYIGTVAIGLTVIELTEEAEVRYVKGKYVRLAEGGLPNHRGAAADRGWTTRKQVASGRLCLQAYSPYPRTKWVRQWRESKPGDLIGLVPGIIRQLERAVNEITREADEGQREAERERQRWDAQMAQWKINEQKRQSAEALKQSTEELHRIINRWAEARRIDDFLDDAARRAAALSPDEKYQIEQRIALARAMAGAADALALLRHWRAPEERMPVSADDPSPDE